MAKKDQHVVPSMSGGWAVRSTGAERASKVFSTQQAAVKHAKEVAKRDKTGLYVHRKDGTVVSRDHFGHPLPSKGKGRA